jgi:filamentous hemagglutinin
VLLEGKVGKALDQKGLLLDYQSKFRKGFTTDGKPIGIGEIDVETPRFIVEIASGRKPGKMDQLSLLQNSTLLNPERKPVILFAPQVDKLQQIKAYENIGVKVINNLDQLFEFGAKKGGL